MQQSQSSSPQSHPKQGFDTGLIGFVTELAELEGRAQVTGDEEEVIMVQAESWSLYDRKPKLMARRQTKKNILSINVDLTSDCKMMSSGVPCS